ncbi:MAG: hypothetical protein QXJ95_09560 [Ignisphaera sp.]
MIKGIRYAAIASEGIDNVFYCWCRTKTAIEGFEEEFKVCNPSEFWKYVDREKSYTEFIQSRYIRPAGYITVSLRSRELFRWGIFELRAKLPRLDGGPMLWFGFELDDLFGGGMVHFMWHCGRGSLAAFAGGFSSRVEMDLTRYLPSDASNNYHLYRIIYREGLALWYIDDKLRAIAIIGCGTSRDSSILYRGKPYTIGFTRDIPSAALPILLDIDGGDIDKPFEWPNLHPWDLRVSEGNPKTPLYLDLYAEDSDEKLSSITIDKEIASAPFPGTLDHKEVVFVSKGDGILVLEGFIDGQWLTYKEYKIESHKLYNIVIDNSNLLYRIVFRPSLDTKTGILSSKVILK